MKFSKKELIQIKVRTSERMMAIAQEGKLSPLIIGHVEAVIYNGLCQLYHDCKKKRFFPKKKKLSKKLIAKQTITKLVVMFVISFSLGLHWRSW